MAFEQPGVANRRERMAQRDERWRREREGIDEAPPEKGTIDYLIWMARQNMTPERREELRLAREKSMRELEEESRRRSTCSECGVDTRHGSHSFRCYWRGM